MLLIHPPVVKPCESPAGLAKLAGALRCHGRTCTVVDANLEGLLYLLTDKAVTGAASDTWTRRARNHLQDHLQDLGDWGGYRNRDRYQRSIRDLNRVLEFSTGRKSGTHLTVANYEEKDLSPLRSDDLLAAASLPEANPFYPYFHGRLSGLLEALSPPMIGFSLNFLSQALCTFAMMGFLRREYPSVKLVLGGGLVTSWMSSPNWRNPFSGLVDDMIVGPGEGPLLELLGSGLDHEDCLPDYGDVWKNPYLAPGFILPYSASRGCYWRRCAFCPEKAEGQPYTPIPADRSVSQLQVLVQRYRPALIHLLDNALSPALLNAVIEAPPGAPWYGFARIEEHLGDPEFCRLLKRSGCVMLKLGLESGDQNVLDALSKGISLTRASEVLKTLKKAGIASYVYLLFGTPAESRESAEKTLAFVAEHAHCIDYLNVAVFNLPAWSAEVSSLQTRTFYAGDLSLYLDFIHPLGWDRLRVRHFLDRRFKRHPAIREILLRDPPVFTSNHAPFFSLSSGTSRL
jgi:hypothetical protein